MKILLLLFQNLHLKPEPFVNKRKEACLCFSFYCNQDKEWRVGFPLWSSLFLLLLLLLLLVLILSLLLLLLPLPLTIVIVVLIIQILAYFEGGHFFYIPVHILIRIFLTSFCSGLLSVFQVLNRTLMFSHNDFSVRTCSCMLRRKKTLSKH